MQYFFLVAMAATSVLVIWSVWRVRAENGPNNRVYPRGGPRDDLRCCATCRHWMQDVITTDTGYCDLEGRSTAKGFACIGWRVHLSLIRPFDGALQDIQFHAQMKSTKGATNGNVPLHGEASCIHGQERANFCKRRGRADHDGRDPGPEGLGAKE